MRGIPDDITAVAASICANAGITDSHARKVFAAAILAERERCADVARRYLEDISGCNLNEDEPEKIAAAIMDPKWEPPPL
ncbi:hypothetical protein [Agrobacterium sp. YIC 4121]|uniref:hypothetical protein n=1 Tax=Agrobacterium sp. YIC 4121 TaxID=1923829 RepID=UPI00098F9F18|nr:hypothetical protein [Agrobacterium sp. YIC 4121]OOO25585.1 hypothetical protein BTE54_23510 [Agrobacterium sp. YIC 4121]